MRFMQLVALLSLTGGFTVAMTACGGDDKAEPVETDADTDADSDADADADTDADADVIDTGLVATITGAAAVDIGGYTYTGTETWGFTGYQSGATICDITYNALDWDSDPLVKNDPNPYANPCIGPDQALCDFAFTVNITGAAESAGDCALFDIAGSWSDMGPSGYGFLEEYSYNGNVYAEDVLMYYVSSTSSPYFGYWLAIADATFDGSNFTYAIDLGLLDFSY